MATRVKSLPRKKKENEPGMINIYCRRCMETKPSKEFYQASDTELDKNNFMSICRRCCGDIYDNSYAIEHSFEKALLRTCKILNMAWVPNAVEATKTHIQKFKEKGSKEFQVFGIYKSKVAMLINYADANAGISGTFEEYPAPESLKVNTPEEDASEDYQELQAFWGKTKNYEEIEYLQSELNALKKGGAPSDTRTEVILLREICFQLLAIKQKRDTGGSVDTDLKTLGTLMQNSAIRPDQQKVANGTKSSDAFGIWNAEIEKYRPLEWWKDHSIYKDVDKIKEYWDVNILRPFLNFWGVQKNFDFEGAVERNESLYDDDGESSEV